MIFLDWKKETKENISALPKEPGVYVVSILFSDGNYRAIFVDAAEDLHNELEFLFSNNCKNVALRSILKENYNFKISYATCLETELLNKIKKYLLDFLEPFIRIEAENADDKCECSLPNVSPFWAKEQKINA